MAFSVLLLVLISYGYFHAAIVSSEGVSMVAGNITVALGDPALLNCTLSSYSGGAGAVSIIISKTAGSFSPDK